MERQQQSYHLMVDNPIHAPVQIYLKTTAESPAPKHFLLSGPGRQSLYQSQQPLPEFDYGWILGKPTPQPQQPALGLPFKSKRNFVVSQGFFGQFSHRGQGNRYALDVAMPMGTDIVAARAGTVAIAKDDYPMSGVKRFFIDKANHITVLHDDDSYAVYAHILQGSAKVKAGQRVGAGQVLARSGSSGYSTGPHLHFVVRYNSGSGAYSIPFTFRTADNRSFTPRRGQKLSN